MSGIPLSVFLVTATVPPLYLCAAHSESPICRVEDGKEREKRKKKKRHSVLGPGSALCGWALGDELEAVNAIRTNAPH